MCEQLSRYTWRRTWFLLEDLLQQAIEIVKSRRRLDRPDDSGIRTRGTVFSGQQYDRNALPVALLFSDDGFGQPTLIDEKQIPYVLDFGLAQTAQSTKLTRLGATLGTVSYMSPEQARGEMVDGRTDIWSLGVVLYEMVAGRSPFPGDYEQAVVYEILNQDPEPITALRLNCWRD